jgi:hypothetical protein
MHGKTTIKKKATRIFVDVSCCKDIATMKQTCNNFYTDV